MTWEIYFGAKLAVVLAGAAASAAGAIAAARRRAATRRRMHAAPKQVEDHAIVTLTGSVKIGERTLVAPISERSCVAYRTQAHTHGGRLHGGTHYGRVELVETAMTPFVLVTETGEVIVDGTSCEIVMRLGSVKPRKIERERAFLLRHAQGVNFRSSGFVEAAIVADMRVAVNGIAQVELDDTGAGETSFREAPRRVRLVGSAANPITIDAA